MKSINTMWMLIISCICLVSVGSPLRTLGQEHGGGDNHDWTYGSAWFLGDKKILYCVEVAPNFGLSKDRVTATLEKSIHTWQWYVEKRPEFFKKPFMNLPFLDVNFSPVPSCDGSEDIKFYFGIRTIETEQIKNTYENPTAFAYRTSYNVKTGWGKGIVWIASSGTVTPQFPDWSVQERLECILLHEIGHVLGCGHLNGTIMDENINAWIHVNSGMHYPFPLIAVQTQIDHARELVLGNKVSHYKGTILPLTFANFVPPIATEETAKETFKLFVGRESSGPIKGDFLEQPGKLVLTLSDNIGSRSFEMYISQIQNQINFDSDGTSLGENFKRVFSGENGRTESHIFAQTHIKHFTTKAFDGKTYVITMQRNFGSTECPVILKYMLTQPDGTIKQSYLFSADWTQRLD